MARSKLRVGFGLSAFAATVAVALAVLSGAPARAATILEKNFWMPGPDYNRDLPACEYHAALDRIIRDFRVKEDRFWNSELQIVGFENIHEIVRARAFASSGIRPAKRSAIWNTMAPDSNRGRSPSS